MQAGVQGSVGGGHFKACFRDAPYECIPAVLPTLHWGELDNRPSSMFILVL